MSIVAEGVDLYIKECTNLNCEFQDGCTAVEKGTRPASQQEQCVYCNSPMKWFRVEDDEEELTQNES